ncbi:molybdenum cofactor guanylyltransferase MobA [Oceanicoccus sp. KOV_DT_Chl]|uniref:molybdenum cofactor guanylyltransferase MobA n=1 Tax=Oceanicoccus sp. KOV_DT_Chl TaxID=1904639 RepID=UPI000C7D530A|nr:molybdenum cofactor guanylyltransferase MobA [Oceanicoccus sp. KOV_DT_Chl]
MKQPITTIILAGGQGQRFNQQDKGLVIWRGKKLVQYVIDQMEPQCQQIIINCNRNIERYQQLGFPLTHDELDGFQGPLAGIQASLPLATHQWALVCACDTPLLPQHLATTLLQAASSQQADIAYPLAHNRQHYLPVLLKRSLLNDINRYLANGERSLKGWYQTMNTVAVPFTAEKAAFSNFNVPEDLL